MEALNIERGPLVKKTRRNAENIRSKKGNGRKSTTTNRKLFK